MREGFWVKDGSWRASFQPSYLLSFAFLMTKEKVFIIRKHSQGQAF